MKIIEGFEFICVDDNIMAVSTGDATDVYKGVINLNKTAYKIWKYIEDGLSFNQIATHLSEEYKDLSIDDANKYVQEFADKLIEKGILTKN